MNDSPTAIMLSAFAVSIFIFSRIFEKHIISCFVCIYDYIFSIICYFNYILIICSLFHFGSFDYAFVNIDYIKNYRSVLQNNSIELEFIEINICTRQGTCGERIPDF